MKLEKRTAGTELTLENTPEAAQAAPASQETSPAQEAHRSSGKPVIMYIMIMFIAAFLLMALSLMMHQRTTAEGIGELQHSFSAMQDMQSHQEKVIELQDELNLAKDDIIRLENELQAQKDDAKVQADALEDENDALLSLYHLQNAYLAENYELCRTTMQTMETLGLVQLLPAQKEYTLPSPAETYAAIKADVELKLAEAENAG